MKRHRRQRRQRSQLQRDNRSAIVGFLLMGIVFYIVLAGFTYRFRHPEQTETEWFINFGNAMLWR